MKKLLSFLGAITLIGTSTTSLVACNKQYREEELTNLKQENKINITNQEIKNNLEWIAPQEKPFNEVDNKYYYVVWRGNINNKWNINNFYNSYGGNYYVLDEKSQIQLLFKNNEYFFGIKEFYNNKSKNKITISKNNVLNVIKEFDIFDINNNYIKNVYRWNGGEENLPDLIIDNNGNVKVNGE
ncbi:lipoprotein [Spiroplasma citri]|uniref:Lipoprotein n=1 Tax=Spiroplasma citri TaxID=2133 RepID=A0AAJ4EJJ5_SPICI|nr:lipoprotein [Spiroplasma citri]QIA68959.1 hypothetical protein GL298_05220 [Spiroplasma citri]QIA70813.1 lipoprotein [Spiroplasma citri]